MTALGPASDGEGSQRGATWPWKTALLAVGLTCLPYLFGWYLQGANPSRAWFSWLGYNLDDTCVYLSWMRQAADGSFFQRNLFTTEPQEGRQFNLFFLLLGNVARFTHLPLLLVYHLARIALGLAFLRSVWWLLGLLVEAREDNGAKVRQDRRLRGASFHVVCFGAGLGWIPGLWREDGIASPVDVWQPESTTFLCLLLSPLFLVSLLLMVGALGWLLVGLRDGGWRAPTYAGLCGLLLGNIHTYDIVTLSAIWGAYLLARAAARRRLEARPWTQAIVAFTVCLPTTAYTAYLVRSEEVFAKRVAVETLSPSILLYLLGFGLMLPLAAVCLSRRRDPRWREARLFLLVWAVANIAVADLPVPFQRKMLMGAHLPIAILAGAGLATLLSKQAGHRLRLAMAASLALLGMTNLRFLLRDAANFQLNRGQSGIQRPYLYQGEMAALQWLRSNTPPGTVIQPLPWILATSGSKVAFVDTSVACFAPGLSGRPVDAGHWGETPSFGEAMGRWRDFLATSDEDERKRLLAASGVRYLVFTQKRAENQGDSAVLASWRTSDKAYLRRIEAASNEDADVYEVVAEALTE